MPFRVYFKGRVARSPDYNGEIINFKNRQDAETFIGIESTQMEFAEYTPAQLRKYWKIKEVK